VKINKKPILLGCSAIALLVILGFGQNSLQESVTAASNARMAPSFEVDPFWPQPLPNQWILGSTIGVAVDQRDHIFIVHRNDDGNYANQEIGLDSGVSNCCTAAPPILEFDIDGHLINSWGGPGQGYNWPASNHGIEIAPNGNIWIGGNGGGDSHVLVFTRDGQFVREIGDYGEDHGIGQALHYAGTPVSFMANVHCAAATQNCAVLEYHPEGEEIPEWTGIVHTTGGQPLLENGYANVPDSPGLGIELNMEHIKTVLHPDDTSIFASTAGWDNR